MRIYHYHSLKSTQDKAKQFLGRRSIVVIADLQSDARGRFKRKWHSGKGGLWMSILLRPRKLDNLHYLTFAAAVSVVQAIKKSAKLQAYIKWPNDVHYKGKKLCGILTETVLGKENKVIVGFGLNVNQTSFPSEIKKTATSLRIILKKSYDINGLSRMIIDGFFHLHGKNAKTLKIWKKYCDTLGKDVTVTGTKQSTKGKAIGIDSNGNLLVKTSHRKTVKVIEGDVKVRY